jgi:hypothetical protein
MIEKNVWLIWEETIKANSVDISKCLHGIYDNYGDALLKWTTLYTFHLGMEGMVHNTNNEYMMIRRNKKGNELIAVSSDGKMVWTLESVPMGEYFQT